MRPLMRAALLVAAVAGAPACSSDPGPPVVLSSGTLIVDWSIELAQDPADCNLAAASAISIHVVTIDGFDAGTFIQDCAAFSTSIFLDPGSYAASAELIDGSGQPRTTTVQIAPFSLIGGDVLTTPIDFPVTSFF